MILKESCFFHRRTHLHVPTWYSEAHSSKSLGWRRDDWRMVKQKALLIFTWLYSSKNRLLSVFSLGISWLKKLLSALKGLEGLWTQPWQWVKIREIQKLFFTFCTLLGFNERLEIWSCVGMIKLPWIKTTWLLIRHPDSNHQTSS